jgi:hypothetical protein
MICVAHPRSATLDVKKLLKSCEKKDWPFLMKAWNTRRSDECTTNILSRSNKSSPNAMKNASPRPRVLPRNLFPYPPRNGKRATLGQGDVKGVGRPCKQWRLPECNTTGITIGGQLLKDSSLDHIGFLKSRIAGVFSVVAVITIIPVFVGSFSVSPYSSSPSSLSYNPPSASS